MVNSLLNRTVLVTGGNNGIGAAIVRAFAREGARIGLHFLAFATQIGYGASKSALEALTRSAACELGPLGITVNAIAPGPVQTGYITPEMEQQLLPAIPLRRLGTPSDIADIVVLFASEQARWMTGQVVQVAGGHAL